MPRQIKFNLTIHLRQLTKDEAEEAGEDWSEFEPGPEVDVVEPTELADFIADFLIEDQNVNEMLAGSEILAAISAVKVEPVS